jgi:hypothetical protein
MLSPLNSPARQALLGRSSTGHPATYTGAGALSEASAWAPTSDIPHHPDASIATTTELSANNRSTIRRGRCPSRGLARKRASSWDRSWSICKTGEHEVMNNG